MPKKSISTLCNWSGTLGNLAPIYSLFFERIYEVDLPLPPSGISLWRLPQISLLNIGDLKLKG